MRINGLTCGNTAILPHTSDILSRKYRAIFSHMRDSLVNTLNYLTTFSKNVVPFLYEENMVKAMLK